MGAQTTIYGQAMTIAAAAPTPATAGAKGEYRLSTDLGVAYICMDATADAAVWAPLNGIGSLSSTLHSPLALWHLNGALTDSVGSLDLAMGAGSAVYSVMGGRKVSRGIGSNYMHRASNDAALTLLGDMTVIAVMTHLNPFGANAVFSFGGNSGAEADNNLYSLATNAAGGLTYTHETGSGSAQSHAVTDGYIGGGFGQLVAVVRASNTIKIYVDGIQVGATSSALTAPTGGGSSQLIIGAAEDGGSKFLGGIAELAIYGSALTAAQVRAQSLRTVGF